VHSIRRKDAVDRGDVVYYLGCDIEVMTARIPPGGVRSAHTHTKATEVNYVVSGATVVETETATETFSAGDVFGFAPDGQMHSVRNDGLVECVILTVKTVTDGADHTRDFQTDKVPSEGRPAQHEPWRRFFGGEGAP